MIRIRLSIPISNATRMCNYKHTDTTQKHWFYYTYTFYLRRCVECPDIELQLDPHTMTSDGQRNHCSVSFYLGLDVKTFLQAGVDGQHVLIFLVMGGSCTYRWHSLLYSRKFLPRPAIRVRQRQSLNPPDKAHGRPEHDASTDHPFRGPHN